MVKLVITTQIKKDIKVLKDKVKAFFPINPSMTFTMKSTKKKILIAKMERGLKYPNFRLFVNDKPYKYYIYKGNKWKELE